MTYTKALEALDARRGHVHTSLDWRRIGEKAVEDLSDDDLIVLEGFEGPTCTARARRAKALAPPPAPPTPAATPRATKPKPRPSQKYTSAEAYRAAMSEALDRVAKGDAVSKDDLALLTEPVQAYEVHSLHMFAMGMNEKNKERNAKIEALEHRNASLAAQVAFEGAQRSALLKAFDARLRELEVERAVTR